MKTTTNARTTTVPPGSLAYLRGIVSKYKIPAHEVGLLLLVGDLLDMIAAGHDMVMFVGSTRNKSAFTVGFKGPGAPDTVYAEDVQDLNARCHALLDDV